MAKLSPVMIAPPLLFVGFALLFLVGMLRDNPNDLPSTFKGEPAPALAADPLGDIPTFAVSYTHLTLPTNREV